MRNAAISAFRARPDSVCAGRGGRILADLHRNPVILNAQPNLLGQISTEEVGPGHRSLVRAGAGDKAVGEAGIKPRMSGRDDANERIRGTHARIKRLTSNVSFEMMAQEAGIARVDLLQPADRGGRIREGFGGNQLREQGILSGVQEGAQF